MLEDIIAKQGFTINHSKTRLQKVGYRQEVTGLIVSDRVNVQKRYIKQLRQWLFYWETHGYERACKYFLPKYRTDKGNVKKGNPNLRNVLSGKLDFLKMVKGSNNSTYLKLWERYSKLVAIQDKKIYEEKVKKIEISIKTTQYFENLLSKTWERMRIKARCENIASPQSVHFRDFIETEILYEKIDDFIEENMEYYAKGWNSATKQNCDINVLIPLIKEVLKTKREKKKFDYKEYFIKKHINDPIEYEEDTYIW